MENEWIFAVFGLALIIFASIMAYWAVKSK